MPRIKKNTLPGSVPSAVADYVTATEGGEENRRRTILTLTALVVATVDNSSSGHGGGVKIYDFPKGYIQIVGGAQKLDLITADGTGLPNDAILDIGVGSTVTPTTDDVLSGVSEDIINKDDITLSAALSAVDQFVPEVTGGGIDGTSTAVDAYLNVACTEGTGDSAGTLTITGTIEIDWNNLGYAGDQD